MTIATGNVDINKELLDVGKSIWKEIGDDIKQTNKVKNVEARNEYMSQPAQDNTTNNTRVPIR
jgi:hypothetical protein